MTVTVNDPFKSAPRISAGKFVDVLRSVGSFDADALWEPWAANQREDAARRIYDYLVEKGHDPAVWLAVAGKEHTFGTNQRSVLWRSRTRSWTNARTVRHPDLKDTAHQIFDPERKSNYVRYASVFDSVRDGVYRVDEPGFEYRKHNAVSIVDHIRIWAPDSDNNRPEQYAQTMCDWINQWIATDTGGKPEPPKEEPPVSQPISGLKDIRHRLQTATDGNRGPLRTVPMSKKNGGVVVHFRGVNTTPAPGYDSFAADATYHVNRTWDRDGTLYGDGIMYHVGIGWDGVKYWMRDFNRVLWHCGETARNESTLAIQLPMGANQRATPAMLKALREVVDDWRNATGSKRSQVWGHWEVSSTSCPGTLMDDFVRPYRAGSDDVTNPDALFIEGNPFGDVPIVAGFRTLFLESGKAKYPDDPIAGGLSVWGYPESAEYPTDDGSAQIFERAIMRWHRGVQAPWDVVMALRHEEIPERAA